MKRFLILLTLATAALMGCAGRGESTVTGGYGASTISGEVSLRDVSSPSPAGVEVSVRGTGMTAILGADGRFAFAGVPEEAVLDFRRAQDGIEASLAVEAGAGFLPVELGQTTAKVAIRLRQSPVGAYEGRVVRATATELVIVTATNGELHFRITGATEIRTSSARFNLRQILSGMIVQVTATTNADGTRTANQINELRA